MTLFTVGCKSQLARINQKVAAKPKEDQSIVDYRINFAAILHAMIGLQLLFPHLDNTCNYSFLTLAIKRHDKPDAKLLAKLVQLVIIVLACR